MKLIKIDAIIPVLTVALLLLAPFAYHRGKESRDAEVWRLQKQLLVAKATAHTTGKTFTTEQDAFASLVAPKEASHAAWLRRQLQWSKEQGFTARPMPLARSVWITAFPLLELLGISLAYALAIHYSPSLLRWLYQKYVGSEAKNENIELVISQSTVGFILASTFFA